MLGTCDRNLDVGLHHDGPLWARHLHGVVCIVGGCHELCQGWPPEDGIVGLIEVGDIKGDILGAVVIQAAEGDERVGLAVAPPL